MTITKVEIKNYKALEHVSFGCDMINLITGKNSSGKTSLLEAIFTANDVQSGDYFLRHLGWRGQRFIRSDARSLFGPMFHNQDLDKLIQITLLEKGLEVDRFNWEISFKKNLSIENVPSQITNGVIQTKHDGSSGARSGEGLETKFSKNGEIITTLKSVLAGNAIQSSVTGKILPRKRVTYCSQSVMNPQEDLERFSDLDKAGKMDSIYSDLRLIEPKLTRLATYTLANGDSGLYAHVNGLGQAVPVGQLGAGFVRLLSTIMTIRGNEKSVVLIDEMENGFHYSVYPKIWGIVSSAIYESKSQAFISSHSLEFIQGMKETNHLGQSKLLRIANSKDGTRRITEFSGQELMQAIESDMDLR